MTHIDGVLNQEKYDRARELLKRWSVWHDDKQLVLSVIVRAERFEALLAKKETEIERLTKQVELHKLRSTKWNEVAEMYLEKLNQAMEALEQLTKYSKWIDVTSDSKVIKSIGEFAVKTLRQLKGEDSDANT